MRHIANFGLRFRLNKWRWDLIGVGAVVLVIWLISTPSSAYFLQIDTAAHDYAALAWVRGCWDFITEKYLSVTILALTYWLLGASSHWGSFWLPVASAFSAIFIYEIGRKIGGSRLVGIAGVLMLLALPGYQFFERTYFGYLFPFLLLGWLAIIHDRWFWAGVCFGLAIEGHFNSTVPVAISSATAFVVLIRQTRWRNWAGLALGTALPWVLVELLFFLYLGPGSFPIYTRSTLAVILTPQVGYIIPPGFTWLPRAIVETNGWLPLIFLAPGLIAPYLVRSDKKALALSASFVGLAGFYTLQAGFTQAVVVPRLLMSSMPFWCINAAIVWIKLIQWVTSPKGRSLAMGAASLVMVISVVNTQLFIREFTRTPYPIVEEWFNRAKAEGRPIRYGGNIRIGMFYAYFYGAETLVNDRRWINDNTPEQAVLIFTASVPPTLSREGYTVTEINQPSQADQTYPSLTKEAGPVRHIELWWPSHKSSPVKPETASPFTGLDATGYYPGSGCASPPTYMNGTMWYYQLVIHKIKQRLESLWQ